MIYGGGGVGWWTLAPRPRLVHDIIKGPPKILGFRSGYKCLSIGSKRSNSNSSEKRGGVFGSGSGSDSVSPPSAGSEFVADMGSESKDHNNVWFQNDFHNQTPSPLMHQHEPQHSKLLTLPTILTLARVVAVPIFVCSMFHNFLFFVNRNCVCFYRLIELRSMNAVRVTICIWLHIDSDQMYGAFGLLSLDLYWK